MSRDPEYQAELARVMSRLRPGPDPARPKPRPKLRGRDLGVDAWTAGAIFVVLAAGALVWAYLANS
ncbi:MAG TPA: hypothetical protein VL460_01155 [Caulobacteraceae bacterium]|jgi:hypothetical protein|nr:hypothetical protein [Caulobacteraceae bacterium]